MNARIVKQGVVVDEYQTTKEAIEEAKKLSRSTEYPVYAEAYWPGYKTWYQLGKYVNGHIVGHV